MQSASSGLLPDSYLALQEWGKGVAFVNGFNLGWYWPLLGPQETLYVPGAVLHPGRNEFVLLELEHAPQHKAGKQAEPGRHSLTASASMACPGSVRCCPAMSWLMQHACSRVSDDENMESPAALLCTEPGVLLSAP